MALISMVAALCSALAALAGLPVTAAVPANSAKRAASVSTLTSATDAVESIGSRALLSSPPRRRGNLHAESRPRRGPGDSGDSKGFKGFNFGAGELQVPLPLPKTLKRTPIDPKKGYAIIELEPGVHFVTEGVYNILIIEADDGVLVVDAPVPMAEVIIPAVREISDAPVTHFVYSHLHSDHVAAAGSLFGGGGVEIVGGAALAEALREVEDPARPVPSLVVDSGDTVTLGGVELKFTELPYSHDRTTTLIELPASGVIMLVDIIYPGWVPFRSFGVAADMRAYINAHSFLLDLEWKHLAAGHLDRPGTRDDVKVAVDYLQDGEKLIREGLATVDSAEIIAGVPPRFRDNPWVVFSQIQGATIDFCYKRIVPAWKDRLAGVDVWSHSSCTRMLEFVSLDAGP